MGARIPQSVRHTLAAAFVAEAEEEHSSRSAVEALKELEGAANDAAFIRILYDAAAMIEHNQMRAELQILAVSLQVQYSEWSGITEGIEQASASVSQLKAGERKELMAGSLIFASAMYAWEMKRFRKALPLFRQLSQLAGYYKNIGNSYLGLYALQRGRKADALRCLEDSISDDTDELLSLIHI